MFYTVWLLLDFLLVVLLGVGERDPLFDKRTIF